MSEISKKNCRVIREFIEIYRRNEFLWKKNSIRKRNFPEKKNAYKTLQNKLAEIDKNATEKTVKYKIRTFRRRFFKELKIVENSIKKNHRYRYEPNLWYFNDLAFIAEREIPKGKKKHGKLSDVRYGSSTLTFIKEFISIYKKNESLWNTTISEYTNKKVNLKGYEELRRKLLTIDKKATIETVKKKIYSLRASFKYNYFHLKRIARLDLRKPESHYINDLIFLKDHFSIVQPETSSGKCDSPEEYKVFENIETEDYRLQHQDNYLLLFPSDEICIKEETCDDNEIQVINQPIIDHPSLNIIDQPGLDLIDQPSLDIIDLTNSDLVDQPDVEIINQPSLDFIDLTNSDLADQRRSDLIDKPRSDLIDQPELDLNGQPLPEDIEKSLSEFKIRKEKPEENKEGCVLILISKSYINKDDEGDSNRQKRTRTKTINNKKSASQPKRVKKVTNIKDHKEPISEPIEQKPIHKDDDLKF